MEATAPAQALTPRAALAARRLGLQGELLESEASRDSSRVRHAATSGKLADRQAHTGVAVALDGPLAAGALLAELCTAVQTFHPWQPTLDRSAH